MRIKPYFLPILLVISTFSEAFMLNLKDASVKTLIDTVSMATGKNFLIDPRVKGTINVVTNSDIDDKQLYSLFLAVMKIHGYILVEGEDYSKILPKNLTKSDSAEQLHNISDKIISTVIPINNVNASKIVPIVRPLMSQYGHLAVYNASNSLIVVDSQINIERLKNLLSELDKSTDSDFETIVLKHSGATEMAQIIKTLIINKNLGSALNMVVDKRNNQIIISGSTDKRLKVRLLVAELDKQREELGGTSVIYLSYANAKEILPTLQNIAKKSDAQYNKGKTDATKQSNITADQATNSIIITGAIETTRNVKHIIKKLDIRRAQVLIEAIIAEISLDDSRDLGIQWISNGGINLGTILGTKLISDSLSDDPRKDKDNNTTPSSRDIFITANAASTLQESGFGIILNALQGSGKANILSTPSLVTLDNEEAEIHVGQNVPFITGTTLSSSNSNPFQKITREDVGLTLKVKPQINNGSSVKLDIDQETTNILPSAIASDIITSKRKIKTSVMVEDGQLLILGGLVDEVWRDSESKVPLLGDIPLLGGLFSNTSKTKVKRNLVVFIRPTILTNPEIANQVSHEKYQFIQALQLLRHNEEAETGKNNSNDKKIDANTHSESK